MSKNIIKKGEARHYLYINRENFSKTKNNSGGICMKADPKFLSFYYQGISELPEIAIIPSKTALLVVDMQKHFLSPTGYDAKLFKEMGEWERWKGYFEHVEKVTLPNTKKLIQCCRENGIEVTYGRIASLKANGIDRARVQSTVGWNNILVPIDSDGAEMMDEVAPLKDEIVVNKTTDSVSLGTNYTQLMHNMGIDTIIVTGVVTDQCVAGTVRVLADQGFKVICVENCCDAPDRTLHDMELKIMNIIYCNVISLQETINLINAGKNLTK